MSRARRLLTAILALSSLGAACASDDGEAVTVDSSTAPTTAPMTLVPARFTDRTCDPPFTGDGMTCHSLEVPERRDVPDARVIELFVVVVTPPGAATDAMPLVLLSGGPGDTFMANIEDFVSIVSARRPLVFVDQRGTGRSIPRLDCPELDVDVDATLPWAERLADGRAAAARCRDRLEASGVDLDGYDTIENAADVVALRNALGYEQWLVYGLSYGGRLAREVLRQDPDGTAGVVLDSSITTAGTGPASLVARAVDAVSRLGAACDAHPPCAAIGDYRALYDAAVARLEAEPHPTTGLDAAGEPIPIVVTGEDVVAGAFDAQYRKDLIPILPTAAKAISEGDSSIVDALAMELSASGDTATGTFHVVTCADEQAGLTDEDQASLADPGRYATLVLGWPWPYCDAWDVDSVPGGVLEVPRSDVPVLLFEGGLDPVAPPNFLPNLTQGLTHTTVVLDPAGGHLNVWTTTCEIEIFNAFLADPRGTLDTSCVDSLPLPFAP